MQLSIDPALGAGRLKQLPDTARNRQVRRAGFSLDWLLGADKSTAAVNLK
jgi:hypothetical protein